MKRFITFENTKDLRIKLENLETIASKNKEIMLKYLIIKNIPYQILPDDSIGVSLGECSPEVLADYINEFGELNSQTMQKFEELGVVYIDTIDNLDFKLNLATRKN